jgi:hypothetical protein
LKMTGEIYDRRSEPRQALPRYWNAWILENRNTDAALYAANLLADNAPSLDPAGELFNTLLRRIFETKGEFLNTGDKLGAQRLNILLGSIFDRRQKWGNEADPFGCIFHWRRALWLEGGLAAKDKDAAREAVLHQRLGEAYQHAHRDPDAWPEYAAAVEKFEESGVPSEAAESFKGLESLRITLSPGQGERLKQLQAKVREAAREP